jgi:hypothetical protein
VNGTLAGSLVAVASDGAGDATLSRTALRPTAGRAPAVAAAAPLISSAIGNMALSWAFSEKGN